MRFTLSLSDYIDQYISNVDSGSFCCPVCYDTVLEHNKATDLEHIVECYRAQLLELEMIDHFNVYGEYPELSPGLIVSLIEKVQRELESYCSINRI